MARDPRILQLVRRYEDALEMGTPCTPEELCAACPDILPAVRAALAAVAAADAAVRVIEPQTAASESPPAGLGLGRYRPPFRLVGRGGQGAVYAARDEDVGRTVAVKVQHARGAADEAARARFQLEAEVLGRLEHPGIVPLYGSGRGDDGRAFYAMRLFNGPTLQVELEACHASPAGPGRDERFRRLLRAFGAVCETVAFAHSRGVIHRDLKPHNVVLGEYGEVLVIDWGLAKQMGAAEPGAASGGSASGKTGNDSTVDHCARSLTGLALGTWAYMPPEQARGEWGAVGPGSDVFGLGAILYAILTGRPPYAGPGAQELARAGRWDPPRAVRTDVPRALDVVCRKAMAPRPGDRYPGAKELAADVQRYLDDEPVGVWREPLPVRARRWAKRHRTALAALAVALVVAVPTLTAADLALTRKNQALVDANEELGRRNEELRSAHAAATGDFDAADRTIRRTTGALDVRNWGDRTATDAEREAVFREARDYYRTFVARNEGRPEMSTAVAFSLVRQAEAEFGLSNDAAAASLLTAAAPRLAALPDAPVATYATARADLLGGRLLVYQHKVAAARLPIARACERLTRLCAASGPDLARFDGPDAPACCLALAVMLLRDLEVRHDPRHGPRTPTPAQSDFMTWAGEAETALRVELARTEPFESVPRLLGLLALMRGEEFAARGRRAEAEEQFAAARAELARVAALPGAPLGAEMMRTYLEVYRAEGLRADGRTDEATAVLVEARTKLRELARREWGPDPFGNRHTAWLFAGNMAKLLGDWSVRTDPRRAGERYRDAVDDLDKVEVVPGRYELSLRLGLMRAYGDIGVTGAANDLPLKLVRDSLARCAGQLVRLGAMLDAPAWLVREHLLVECKLAFVRAVDGEATLPQLEDATDRLEKFADENPVDDEARLYYGNALLLRGSARMIGSRWDEARADLELARTTLRVLLPRSEPAQALQRQACVQLAHLAAIRSQELQKVGALTAARDWLRAGLDALADAERTRQLGPDERAARDRLRTLLEKSER